MSSQRSPIFFWAIHFILGCSLFLVPHWVYVVPLFFISFLSKRKIQGIVFLVAGMAYVFFKFPSFEGEKWEGKGIFTLQSISPFYSPFNQSLALKGRFKTFESNQGMIRNIPCVIFSKEPPQQGQEWIIEGTLQKKDSFHFVFKPKNQFPWKEIDPSFSLVQWRFKNKEKIRHYFHQHCQDKRVGHFFASMATGDVDDRLLSMEFRKLGLGHIFAISGFHFALLAAVLGGILRLFLPPKIAYISLLIGLAGYFIFLGTSPSVLRSFVTIALYLFGLILKRPMDGINLFGVALLIELIYDPLSLTQLSFQLSFLATLGIILFYSPCERWIDYALPKRSPLDITRMSLLNQHGYLLSSGIRQGLALNLAVLLATLPISLYVFRTFPLFSIPYNLILTPFLSLSLIVLPFGILIPPLAILNEQYTSWILKLISYPPEILDFKIFISYFPFSLLILMVSLLIFWGLTKRWQIAKTIPKQLEKWGI